VFIANQDGMHGLRRSDRQSGPPDRLSSACVVEGRHHDCSQCNDEKPLVATAGTDIHPELHVVGRHFEIPTAYDADLWPRRRFRSPYSFPPSRQKPPRLFGNRTQWLRLGFRTGWRPTTRTSLIAGTNVADCRRDQHHDETQTHDGWCSSGRHLRRRSGLRQEMRLRHGARFGAILFRSLP